MGEEKEDAYEQQACIFVDRFVSLNLHFGLKDGLSEWNRKKK